MASFDFTINQGATFNPVLKYSQPQFTVKPITGLTNSGQAVVTAAGHGLTVDWPVWIVGVGGMQQINHRSTDLSNASKAYFGYFVDANTIRLNLDTTRFSAYTSGGELLYHPPIDLTNFTARMEIRVNITDADPVVTLTTENGGITLGGAAGTIALLIDATATALLTFLTGVYDLEVVDGSGVVTRILSGNVSVSAEVTR